jgi:hypothetical protein
MTIGTAANGSGQSGTLTFNGTLGGFFSSENAGITNSWSNPLQSLTLGNYTFTVQLNSFTAPGVPGENAKGSFNAIVTVSNAIGTGSVPSPEPSTMLLSSLGLTFLGGAAWRKRRTARAQASA